MALLARGCAFDAIGVGAISLLTTLWIETSITANFNPAASWSGGLVCVHGVLLGLVCGLAGTFWAAFAGQRAPTRVWSALGTFHTIFHFFLVLVASSVLGALTGMAQGWIWQPKDEVVIAGGVVAGIWAGMLIIPLVYASLHQSQDSGVLASYTMVATLVVGLLGAKVAGIYSIVITPVVALIVGYCVRGTRQPGGASRLPLP